MDHKIIEYHLYTAAVDESDGGMRCPLTSSANEFIEDGYQPYGDPFVLSSPHSCLHICQVFVKYAAPPRASSSGLAAARQRRIGA